jgi:hypothetical protein
MKSTNTAPGGLKLLTLHIVGASPLLMNPLTEQQLVDLHHKQKGQDTSKLKPVQVAASRLYQNDGNRIGIPGTNLMAAIIGGGEGVPNPKIKGGKSMITTSSKSVVPSFLFLHADSEFLVFSNIGEPFDPQKDIDMDAVIGKPSEKNPFIIDIRRGVNPSTGGATPIIRPKILKWEFSVKFEWDPSECDEELLRTIINNAGNRCGLGDFRPKCKGMFGRFRVADWKVESIKDNLQDAA